MMRANSIEFMLVKDGGVVTSKLMFGRKHWKLSSWKWSSRMDRQRRSMVDGHYHYYVIVGSCFFKIVMFATQKCILGMAGHFPSKGLAESKRWSSINQHIQTSNLHKPCKFYFYRFVILIKAEIQVWAPCHRKSRVCCPFYFRIYTTWLDTPFSRLPNLARNVFSGLQHLPPTHCSTFQTSHECTAEFRPLRFRRTANNRRGNPGQRFSERNDLE